LEQYFTAQMPVLITTTVLHSDQGKDAKSSSEYAN